METAQVGSLRTTQWLPVQPVQWPHGAGFAQWQPWPLSRADQGEEAQAEPRQTQEVHGQQPTRNCQLEGKQRQEEEQNYRPGSRPGEQLDRQRDSGRAWLGRDWSAREEQLHHPDWGRQRGGVRAQLRPWQGAEQACVDRKPLEWGQRQVPQRPVQGLACLLGCQQKRRAAALDPATTLGALGEHLPTAEEGRLHQRRTHDAACALSKEI